MRKGEKVPGYIWGAVIGGIIVGALAFGMGYESGLAKSGQGLLAPIPGQ